VNPRNGWLGGTVPIERPTASYGQLRTSCPDHDRPSNTDIQTAAAVQEVPASLTEQPVMPGVIPDYVAASTATQDVRGRRFESSRGHHDETLASRPGARWVPCAVSSSTRVECRPFKNIRAALDSGTVMGPSQTGALLLQPLDSSYGQQGQGWR
jgi:hypothetical protein